MCDYSLHSVKNRLALDGEQLFVNKFHTGSKGLAAVAEWEPVKLNWLQRLTNHLWPHTFEDPAYHLAAVCVPPGARLRLSGIPSGTRQELGVGEVEEVVFAQKDPWSHGYRDCFEFANGHRLLIQLFHEGLRVEVLSLGLEEKTGAVAEKSVERRMSANA